MFFFGGASALALLSFAAQALGQSTCPKTADWVKCTGAPDFDCTTIRVPYDWGKQNEPNAKFIDLKLIRAPVANNPNNAQSIIVNPGGPGGSGIDFVLKGGRYLRQRAGEVYNIIGWDPRGVGLNMPYFCDPKNNGYGYAPRDRLQTTINEYFEKSAQSYLAGAKECAAQNSDDKSVIDSINTAYDVHAISQAIGGDKLIRYWGFSYGTLLGNVIARIFPNWIDRMILDGNIDPDSYYFGPSYVEASDVVRATQQFFRLCSQSKDTNCAWTALSGQRTYENLIAKYNDWVGINPFAEKRGRTSTITDDQSFFIRSLMHGALKAPKKFKKLSQILQEWYNYPQNIRQLSGEGDDIDNYVLRSPSRVRRQAQTSAIVRNFDPTKALDENNSKARNALSGIRCIDLHRSARSTNPNDYQTWWNEFANRNYYSGDSSMSYIVRCAPWQMSSSYAFNDGTWASKGKIATRNPILFVQTYYDTVTPQQSAINAASYYRDSGLVYTEGVGHCSDVNPSNQLFTHIQNYWANPGQKPTMPPPLGNDGKPLTLAVNVKNVFDRDPGDPPVPNEQVMQTGQTQGSPAKRDLSYLFEGLPSTPIKRSFNFMIRRDNDTTSTNNTIQAIPTEGDGDYVPCDNSTSSTNTASSATTTSTGINSTYTGSYTGMYTNAKTTKGSGSSTGSVWNEWESGKVTTDSASTWTTWDPKKPSTTPAPTGTWGPWSSKGDSDSWEAWTSQDDSIPVTKTVCKGGKDCSTVVVAIPTKTVYVDYFIDVCETGITTKTATVTATCAKGCEYKPTGIPDGYTTKSVYCSACATPSTVLVTVTVSKPSEWANVDATSSAKKTSADPSWSTWTGATGTATSKGSKPTSGAAGSGSGSGSGNSVSDWNPWVNGASGSAGSGSGSATGTGAWSTWADATATGPMVAKYTGAASTNDICMRTSVFAAVLAGLWFL